MEHNEPSNHTFLETFILDKAKQPRGGGGGGYKFKELIVDVIIIIIIIIIIIVVVVGCIGLKSACLYLSFLLS